MSVVLAYSWVRKDVVDLLVLRHRGSFLGWKGGSNPYIYALARYYVIVMEGERRRSDR